MYGAAFMNEKISYRRKFCDDENNIFMSCLQLFCKWRHRLIFEQEILRINPPVIQLFHSELRCQQKL